MSHDEGRMCVCRSTHAPHPLELELHHIHPLGMGGPDVEDNWVWVCPTTHTNIHELLRLFVKLGRVPEWIQVTTLYEDPVSRYAYVVARDGFHRWTAASGR